MSGYRSFTGPEELPVELVTFQERADRSRYIAERFGASLIPSLLDVGCDQALLKELLPLADYIGVDMGGLPDLRLNLETVQHLPFEDGQFHSCVCSDVLEHLDNLHAIFAELVRVTQRYLLISLPNNWANARRPIERGHGRIAHYGLPPERPGDRHKWFFGFDEARAFLLAQCERYPLRLKELVANDKPRNRLTRGLRRLRYPGDRYLNRYAHTLWALFERE